MKDWLSSSTIAGRYDRYQEGSDGHEDGTDRGGWAQAALLDNPEFLRAIVERPLQAILEEEMAAHLGTERYGRTGERRGYRNGTNPRTLTTRVGTLALLVAQDRGGDVLDRTFRALSAH